MTKTYKGDSIIKEILSHGQLVRQFREQYKIITLFYNISQSLFPIISDRLLLSYYCYYYTIYGHYVYVTNQLHITKEIVGLSGAVNRELYKTLYRSIPAAYNLAGFLVWKECMTQRQWNTLIEAARTLPAFVTVVPSVSTENAKVQEACNVLVIYILSLYCKVPANIAGVVNVKNEVLAH